MDVQGLFRTIFLEESPSDKNDQKWSKNDTKMKIWDFLGKSIH